MTCTCTGHPLRWIVLLAAFTLVGAGLAACTDSGDDDGVELTSY